MNIKSIFFLVILFQLVFSNLSEYSCISQIGDRDIYRNDYTYPESIQGEHFVIHFTTSDADSQFVNNQWMNFHLIEEMFLYILKWMEYTLQ